MQPKKGSDILQIPITFDTKGGNRASVSARPLWVFLALLLWFLSSLFVFIAASGFLKVGYPILSFIGVTYIIRFIIVRERYFKSKRKELMEKEYMFNHSVFWNIYEIRNRYPHIVSFGNGLKGVFIAFDKDVIVGKDNDYDYYHHEAIANAYQQMEKRQIECMHIDYMDTVGKDERLQDLFSRSERIVNKDLRKVMTRIFAHIERKMNRAYASYDVYCFYSKSREDLFWDELQVVLQYFGQANYIRHRVLDRDDISMLVKSIMNIEDFSVNRANDNLFKELNQSEHIRPIWVENSDTGRTILNKTLEEIAEVKRVQKSEKKLKKVRKNKGLFKKQVEEEEIDLFD